VVPNVATTGHSFNGALQYYLHDKGAQTADRVTWTATRNIGIDNVDVARRVMIATASRAAEIKKAAGVKATGRKGEAGAVYAYSLAWHPDEAGKIDRAEMMKAAESSLIALGAEGHQAIIVAHQDEPQPHVHVILNRVHPDTGIMLPTGNDFPRLSAWALAYREARGEHLKYCPQRAKNAETRARHPDQQQRREYVRKRIERDKLAQTFERSADPSKRKGAPIKARADAMKARHDQEWKELQAAHKSEREAIWKSRASFKAIIAQHRTDTRPDWSAFGKRQARERREWHRNERSTIGLINNALAAVASRQITGDNKGYLRAVFWHCVSKSARLDAFTQQQAREKADFAAKMKAPLDRQLAAAKADTDKRIQLARANYAERKATLKEKQGGERSEIREAWKLYFAHRNAATNWRDRSTMRAAGSRRSSPAVGTPARSTPPLERAAGAQSVSELREAYGGEKRERNRDRDRSQSRRKERYRSRTRDRDSGPDLS
jgi:hypothetical protein